MSNFDRMILMNPGPVTMTARVRAALASQDLCHREPEFAELQADLRRELVKVYEGSAKDYTAVLMTGSGTAAVESMISSLIAPTNARALVLANGVYGDRMKTILSRQGKPFDSLDRGWTEDLDLEALEKKLSTDKSITHVLAIHHETTTGRLNPINKVGALCKKYGVLLLLDAVSSFGGEEIEFDAWNLGALAATANKCLHGAPGISFVIAKRSLLAGQKTHSPSLYLDLGNQFEAQEKSGSAFTQATHVCLALAEALRELQAEGGWKARHRKYKSLSEQVRTGLAQMGIKTFLDPKAEYSSILTSFFLPKGKTYEQLHDHLKEHGFVIYAGQGNFKNEMFRLAFMGDMTTQDMSRLLEVFKRV